MKNKFTDICVAGDSSVPLYARIADALGEAVATGRVEPGERLPAKGTLAVELGTSGVTVGRAYELLQGRGIVVQKRGSGTYVTEDAPQRLQVGTGPRFSTITVVVGEPTLADCSRETVDIAVDILTGLKQELGGRVGEITFAETIDQDALARIPDDGAVLFHINLKRLDKIEPTAVDALARRGIPMLGIWGYTTPMQVPRVRYDHIQAVTLGCQHLADCGYQRIGYLGPMGGTNEAAGIKFLGFTTALYQLGLDYQICHVRDVWNSPGAAYEAVCAMIDAGDLPEAFYIDTDHKAMEAIRALRHAGLRVPEDVGVVSHGDIPDAAMFDPPLTAVHTPRRAIGRRAAQLLLDWDASAPLREDVVVDAELVVRKTTAHAADRSSVHRATSS